MRTWLAAVVVSCLPAMAAAQGTSYPTKPVTIVVPAAPGGVIDTLGRTLAQNSPRPGEPGRGRAQARREQSDRGGIRDQGTTGRPHAVDQSGGDVRGQSVSLYKRLPYDPVKGFTPITGPVTINHGLIAQSVGARLRASRTSSRSPRTSLARSTTARSASARAAISTWKFPDLVRRQVHRGPLQGRDAGADRRDRRPHPDDVHQRRQRGAAMAGGKVKLLAVGAGEAHGAASRGSDRRGKRIAGLRGSLWFALFGPPGMPTDVVGQDQCRGAADLCGSRIQARRSSTGSISRPSSARRRN